MLGDILIARRRRHNNEKEKGNVSFYACVESKLNSVIQQLGYTQGKDL